MLTRLEELGLDPAHIVGQDDVLAFLRCQAGSVAAWHARRLHRIISSFLCKTEGVKSPVRHGAGFLGSLEKAGLRTESRPHIPECFNLFMNEDTLMQE